MNNITFIPFWAVHVLTAGHGAVLALPVLSIVTGTWSWGTALAPSGPCFGREGREKSPGFFTTDCKGQLFNGILSRGSPKRLGCSESGPWGCTGWVTGRGIKNLWVIIPNTTEQICSGLFLCSYVLTNVQRNSESPFPDLSPMKNAALCPPPSLHDLAKPGVPLLPRLLLKSPQIPVAAGWALVLSQLRGRARAGPCASSCLCPCSSATPGSRGTTLKCLISQWAPALWESQSDLWRGFSMVAATQHLQRSDKNTLKWTSCHLPGDIPTAYLSLRPQELWNLCIFRGHVNFAILLCQSALTVLLDSDGTIIPPILN